MTVDPHVPRSLIVVPSFRCPLRCQHCDLSGLSIVEPVPVEVWCERIGELAGEVEPPFMVGISGGEPLVYPGLHHIVRTCREAGFFVAVGTSALPLNEVSAGRLLEAGISALVVSIDGLAPTHDLLRGYPGLFQHALSCLRLVRRLSPRLSLSIVATVTRPAVGQLVGLVELAQHDPAIDAICFHTLSANLGGPDEHDPRWHRGSELWPGGHPGLDDELGRLMELAEQGAPIVNSAAELAQMRRFYRDPDTHLRPCDQVDQGLLMLPGGIVKLCPLQDPVGRFDERGLLELWRSDAARRLRRRMRRCQRNCHFLTNFAYQRHLIPGAACAD